MSDKIKMIAAATGVAGVTFAICALVVGLEPAQPKLFIETSAGRIEVERLSPDEPTWEEVRAEVKKAPPLTEAEQAAELQQRDFKMAKISMEISGYEVSDDLLAAAYNDAPAIKGYVNFTTLERPLVLSEMEPVDQRKMKIACLSMKNPDEAEARHIIYKYDDTRFFATEIMTFDRWISSGCGQAMQKNGRQLNHVQLNVELEKLMPDTPEFAPQRRELLNNLNAQRVAP